MTRLPRRASRFLVLVANPALGGEPTWRRLVHAAEALAEHSLAARPGTVQSVDGFTHGGAPLRLPSRRPLRATAMAPLLPPKGCHLVMAAVMPAFGSHQCITIMHTNSVTFVYAGNSGQTSEDPALTAQTNKPDPVIASGAGARRLDLQPAAKPLHSPRHCVLRSVYTRHTDRVRVHKIFRWSNSNVFYCERDRKRGSQQLAMPGHVEANRTGVASATFHIVGCRLGLGPTYIWLQSEYRVLYCACGRESTLYVVANRSTPDWHNVIRGQDSIVTFIMFSLTCDTGLVKSWIPPWYGRMTRPR